jgi:UDP-glucose 4-epimerase
MKKCIVTGGAGFIGSTLVDRLIEKGYAVSVIDDLSTGKEEYINSKATFHNVDIRSRESQEVILHEKPDIVFHLAAQIAVLRSIEDPLFDNDVNARGSFNIFESCVRAGVGKVVFFSTGGALYGECDVPATEDTLIEPVSPYAIHKYTAERYLAMLDDVHGLNYAVIRPANIYGPRQYKGGECGVVGIFIHNALKSVQSVQFGDGTKTRDYVYVDDVVDATIQVSEGDVKGVFNVGTARRIRNLDIMKTVEKITGERFDVRFEDDKAGEVFNSVLSYAKLETVLGWKPKVSFEEGLEKTVEWMRDK